MPNVYALGHGFMFEDGRKINLVCDMTSYVRDGTMLDGRGLQSLIDNGEYRPEDPHDPVTELKTYRKGDLIIDHLLCSDMLTIKDIKNGVKWQHKTGVNDLLPQDLGRIITLDNDTYVYVTIYNWLVRLSDFQQELKSYLDEDFHLHWGACRSYVPGTSDAEIVDFIAGNSPVQPEGMKVRLVTAPRAPARKWPQVPALNKPFRSTG